MLTQYTESDLKQYTLCIHTIFQLRMCSLQTLQMHGVRMLPIALCNAKIAMLKQFAVSATDQYIPGVTPHSPHRAPQSPHRCSAEHSSLQYWGIKY